MAFSNYEWIAEQLGKIKELERRVEALEQEIRRASDKSGDKGGNQ